MRRLVVVGLARGVFFAGEKDANRVSAQRAVRQLDRFGERSRVGERERFLEELLTARIEAADDGFRAGRNLHPLVAPVANDRLELHRLARPIHAAVAEEHHLALVGGNLLAMTVQFEAVKRNVVAIITKLDDVEIFAALRDQPRAVVSGVRGRSLRREREPGNALRVGDGLGDRGAFAIEQAHFRARDRLAACVREDVNDGLLA